MSYRILFIGDVMGRPGRTALHERLPNVIKTHNPLFVIINGENSAAGVGITPDIANDLFALGADGITLGNHAFNKREIIPHLANETRIIRPINMPTRTPGKGEMTLTKEGITLHVVNCCGRVFLDGYDDPFRAMDEVCKNDTGHLFVDFHAEATSEKVAMGWHLDGRATAMVGTHTHVQTADERILPGGTAYITDVGMTGPENGVIGMDKTIVLNKFRTSMPARFEVADGVGVICGVLIGVERNSGRAISIERIRDTGKG